MTIASLIAKHIREVHFGGNWTVSSLKEHTETLTWEQATTKVEDFNPIATLVFHINYFAEAILKVLDNQPLTANDKYSFDCPPIYNQADWEGLLAKSWSAAERLAAAVEALPDERLTQVFVQEKYGIYYRNLHGFVEHTHYHLGQIALVKKLVLARQNQ